MHQQYRWSSTAPRTASRPTREAGVALGWPPIVPGGVTPLFRLEMNPGGPTGADRYGGVPARENEANESLTHPEMDPGPAISLSLPSARVHASPLHPRSLAWSSTPLTVSFLWRAQSSQLVGGGGARARPSMLVPANWRARAERLVMGKALVARADPSRIVGDQARPFTPSPSSRCKCRGCSNYLIFDGMLSCSRAANAGAGGPFEEDESWSGRRSHGRAVAKRPREPPRPLA